MRKISPLVLELWCLCPVPAVSKTVPIGSSGIGRTARFRCPQRANESTTGSRAVRSRYRIGNAMPITRVTADSCQGQHRHRRPSCASQPNEFPPRDACEQRSVRATNPPVQSTVLATCHRACLGGQAILLATRVPYRLVGRSRQARHGVRLQPRSFPLFCRPNRP